MASSTIERSSKARRGSGPELYVVKLIVGHSNMDLDCIASVALARRLHPDFTAVKSNTVHPVARHLYNLYETELDFLPTRDLKGATLEELIIVDTRSFSRVKEYFQALGLTEVPPHCPVTIYDHHPGEPADFPGARVIGGNFGSTATILARELLNRGISPTPEEATIALAGIYGDTGNFTHENVGPDEFTVAAFLLAHGATVRLATSFLKSLRDDEQVELFHQALGLVTNKDVKGHQVGRFVVHLEKQASGLAAVVERVFEVEDLDGLFGVFYFEDSGSTLVVGRSHKPRLKVNAILETLGGGGHFKAASAVSKGLALEEVLVLLDRALDDRVEAAITARDIMTARVSTIPSKHTLLEASRFLEQINHTGAPVVDGDGRLVGFMTLRDIMKGRRLEKMHTSVKGFMTPQVVTCSPEHTVHDLEELFFVHNIGHLPVVNDGALVGIITRSDYLRTIAGA